MAFQTGQITTGLMGYSLRKDFLGDGLFYRETEVYDYELYGITSYSSSGTPFKEIEDQIKARFTLHSGDINVKVLSSPADYLFPNDHLRAGKIEVQVEVRSVPINLTGSSPELTGNYYKGLDASFFSNYATVINDFTEEFSFEDSENGTQSFNHSLSFSLRTGGKNLATQIASGVFLNDKDTTFGISTFVGVDIANTGSYFNYYNESYDLVRNTFSFDKKREILTSINSTYTFDFGHTLDFKQDGIIDVSERGNIQGKISFEQAKAGMGTLLAGAYLRCVDVYNSYKNLSAGTSVTESLASLSKSSTKTLNKPALSANYEITYSNDPNLLSANFVSVNKTIDVTQAENKYIEISHAYDYIYLKNPVYNSMDVDYMTEIASAITNSPIEIASYYTASPFFNSAWPTMNQLKRNFSTPNRRKNFSASFSYTNNPTYFVTVDGYQYPILDFKISDTKPQDILSEYKIINRPTKSSIINYAYQTEKGAKTINLTAKAIRAGNEFNSPRTDLAPLLLSLYKFSVRKTLESFISSSTILSLTYYLSDIKYSISSESDIRLDITVTYAIKKYIA